jgi:hypothetical protein
LVRATSAQIGVGPAPNPRASAGTVLSPCLRWPKGKVCRDTKRSLKGGTAMGVGRNADGRLEVFARGTDNRLWHSWQAAKNAGPWSGFSSLSGAIVDGPSVARSRTGRLHVFARGLDDTLQHIAQTAPNGPWGMWESLGGTVLATPAVARNKDGRLEVFVLGREGILSHISEQEQENAWSGWHALGGSLIGPVAVCAHGDGRLVVFGRASDTTLAHISQNVPDAPPTGWSAWGSLPGPVTNTPAAVLSTDVLVEVCYASTGGELRLRRQSAPGANTWDNPISLAGILVSPPAISRNQDGRLEMFHIGVQEKRLYNAWQTTPNGSWHGWTAREMNQLVGILCVARNDDHRLEVFAIDDVGNVQHTWQSLPSEGPWGTESLGGATLGGVGVKLAELGFREGWERHE